MIISIMPAQAMLISLEDRTLIDHQAHLAPFLATNVQAMVQAAEAQVVVEMGFPAALAEPRYHNSQSGSRGFQ